MYMFMHMHALVIITRSACTKSSSTSKTKCIIVDKHATFYAHLTDATGTNDTMKLT
jgi:hypothetical protein